MLEYVVLYESETGNTKKIAAEIFSSLPGMSKDLINIQEREDFPDANVYFVGFCVRHGTCSLEIGHLLGSFADKDIAIFGTCGAGNSEEYCRHIENSARIWIEDDNRYLGGFFCQGKMPLQVRQKYEALLQKSSSSEADLIQRQLMNFDEAMIHPTNDDCKHAREFTCSCLDKLNHTFSD